jgi:hypothetical protein
MSMRAVLPVLLVLLATGCDLFADAAAALPPEGVEAGAPAPTLVTTGCPVEDITGSGDVVCASCAFDGAAVAAEICGTAARATCETRQNSFGRACQLCVADDGNILYDDCFTVGADAAPARCEETPGAIPDEVCSTCFDSSGVVVSATCRPRGGTCVEVVIDGLVCEQCEGAGGALYRDCPQVDIDPSECRSYGDDDGSCVDCFASDGTLLTHRCTPPFVGSFCEETYTPDGLLCTVCSDANGVPTSQACQAAPLQPERCAQLDYSEQTCFVCVDSADSVVVADCRARTCAAGQSARACRVDADCGDPRFACFDGVCTGLSPEDPVAAPEECPPPPPCSTTTDENGDVCRTCPRADGVLETRCLSSSALACEVLAEESLPAAGDGAVDAADPAPPPQGRTCTLCRAVDSGIEVYRDCAGNGAIPPPSCTEERRGDGTVCEVCRDAVDATVVYQACPDRTCYGEEVAPLVGVDGAFVLIEDAKVAARCRLCDDTGAFLASCSVDGVCGSDGQGQTACPVPARLLLQPRSCGTPWQAHVAADGARDAELRGLVAWALQVHGLVLFGADTVAAVDPDGTCDSCDCPRGDRIAVTVAAAELARARAAFAAVLAP